MTVNNNTAKAKVPSDGLLPMLMTRSSIADRHRKRRERTLKGITRINNDNKAFASTSEAKQAFDDMSVFTLEQQPTPAVSSASLFQVILAASVGAGLAQYLLGPRSSKGSSISSRPHLSATFQSNGALALQQQHSPSMVLLKNRLRAGRVLGAAGTTSLLFGTKHYMQQQQNGNNNTVVSSAAAGAAMATVTTPLYNLSRMAPLHNMAQAPPSTMFALFSKNAPRIYTREMTGAIVLFGVYESLVGTTNGDVSAPTVLGAGALSGALYRTVVTGSAAAALRSMPFYAVLFFGYETTLRL